MITRAMDMKIRVKDGNGNYHLIRPYLRANVDDIGNVMNYTIVGSEEEGSLNEVQEKNFRDMCRKIDRYLGRLVRSRRNDFTCYVNDFPSVRQVRNLLSGRTRRSGMIFPLTGIELGNEAKRIPCVSAGKL